MLLGDNFLKFKGISVNFGNGIVTVSDVLEITFQQTPEIEPKRGKVPYDVLPQKLCTDVLGLIIPCGSSESNGIKPGSSIMQITSHNLLVLICLVNETNIPYVIEKEGHVADVQLLKRQDSICETVFSVRNNKSIVNA